MPEDVPEPVLNAADEAAVIVSTGTARLCSAPRILDGNPYVEDTRICAFQVAERRQEGATPEAVADEYDLTLPEVYLSLAYAYDNDDEMSRWKKSSVERRLEIRSELVSWRDVGRVYQPAPDSYLLAEAAIARVADDERVLDVGTGSGYVGARIQADTGATVFGSEINGEAVRTARASGLAVVRADLTSAFQARTFDLVTFNPPYLPASEAGADDSWREQARSGGSSGREVIEQFLEDVNRLLSPAGRVLLLASSYTGIDAVAAAAREAGFVVRTAADQSFPSETLTVLRLQLEA